MKCSTHDTFAKQFRKLAVVAIKNGKDRQEFIEQFLISYRRIAGVAFDATLAKHRNSEFIKIMKNKELQ